jgi:hypothetical protein
MSESPKRLKCECEVDVTPAGPVHALTVLKDELKEVVTGEGDGTGQSDIIETLTKGDSRNMDDIEVIKGGEPLFPERIIVGEECKGCELVAKSCTACLQRRWAEPPAESETESEAVTQVSESESEENTRCEL